MDSKQTEFINAFIKEFEPHLGTSTRWDAFCYLAHHLSMLDRPVHIGETGCARSENWLGDGNSTLIWSWIVDRLGGSCFTVDLSSEAIMYTAARCPNVRAVRGDSVTFLRQNLEECQKLDLLYLDSYDWHPPYYPSEFHHLAEVSSVFCDLPKGCLIAIDDCHEEYRGKHAVVKRLFEAVQVPQIISSYICIWQKHI